MPPAAREERYVALLRGVNVGGKNKIAMVTLAGMFTDFKCRDVATYIQSGNVVFSADAKAVAKVGGFVCASIEKQLGFQTSVIVRSLTDIKRISASNPYKDVEQSHVMFLADEPSAAQVATLDHSRSAPDEFTVVGSEIYLYLPNGAGNSKLTVTYFDSKLKTVGTQRNWRTVQKLRAMMSA